MELYSSKKPTLKNLVISFVDLTGFAKISKQLSDEEVFCFLSEFYEMVESEISSAGGMVIKFIGDAALVVFPEEKVDQGILAIKRLKEQIESWVKNKGFNSKLICKIHFGPAVIGEVGGKNSKQIDIVGEAVNATATLASSGFSITSQAFRKLSAITRKEFKKHTPPYYYIPVEERHKR